MAEYTSPLNNWISPYRLIRPASSKRRPQVVPPSSCSWDANIFQNKFKDKPHCPPRLLFLTLLQSVFLDGVSRSAFNIRYPKVDSQLLPNSTNIAIKGFRRFGATENFPLTSYNTCNTRRYDVIITCQYGLINAK
jgi:hypothetical protein